MMRSKGLLAVAAMAALVALPCRRRARRHEGADGDR